MKIIFSANFIFLIMLFISFNLKAQAPPVVFDKATLGYKILNKIAGDLDQQIKELGLRVFACSVIPPDLNAEQVKLKSYPSLINCLFVSLDLQLRKKISSEVKLWVLNKEDKYLPPLSIKWVPSSKNWWEAIKEVMYLSFEEYVFKFKNSNPASVTCQIDENFLNNDLGNIIGVLELKVQPNEIGLNILDYLGPKYLSQINGFTKATTLRLTVKNPFLQNHYRIYDANLILESHSLSKSLNQTNQGENSKILEIKLRTNHNLFGDFIQRKTCYKGEVQQEKVGTQ